MIQIELYLGKPQLNLYARKPLHTILICVITITMQYKMLRIEYVIKNHFVRVCTNIKSSWMKKLN
jgi:hypothetical protein